MGPIVPWAPFIAMTYHSNFFQSSRSRCVKFRNGIQGINKLLFLYLILLLVLLSDNFNECMGLDAERHVRVYHYINKQWGDSAEGVVDCPLSPHIKCEWTWSESMSKLKHRLMEGMHGSSFNPHAHKPSGSFRGASTELAMTHLNKSLLLPEMTTQETNNSSSSLQHNSTSSPSSSSISVAVYNIHYYWERTRTHTASCELSMANFTVAESEESGVRFNKTIFLPSFKNFDASSTTHPYSTIPRLYHQAFMNETQIRTEPIHNFSSLIKGATYVAHDCHKRDSSNSHRDTVIQLLRNEGMRIDGLSKCMRSSTGPEGVTLSHHHDMRVNIAMKREAIAKYMFNMAFENSIEDGYVTEKAFDALIAGTVPVYLGDAAHLRSLLPHPNAAIFIADFGDNFTAIAERLNYLMHNETAYEELRSWRRTFNFAEWAKTRPLLQKSWFCRVCDWAAESITDSKIVERSHSLKKKSFCDEATGSLNADNKAVRGSGKQVYLLSNNTLRAIPNMQTLESLKINLEDVLVISDHELKKYAVGDPLPSAL